ncbi:AEC family transporter [Rhodovibrionaceae bacterium A322]
MLMQLIAILAPVFLTVAIGYIWGRKDWPFDSKAVTLLVMYVGTPCLLITTFDKARPTPAAFAEMALVTFFAFLAMMVLSYLLLKLFRLSAQDYMPALLFPNSGNIGLPISLFAFQEAGMALAIVVLAFSAVGNFTVGAGIAQGRADIKGMLRMPLIYAVLIGLLLVVTGIRLPHWVSNTFDLLGGFTIPLMLLALGVSLAKLKISSLKVAFGLSLVRLLGGFAIAVALAALFQLDDLARNILILQFSMPVAIYSYLFALRFDRAAPEVASMVIISTLMAALLLPLLLAYLL